MRCLWCTSHGLRWRNLRRISVTSLFSPWRTASFGEFRKTIGLKVVDEMMEKKGEVKVKKMFHFGSLDYVMMSVFGRSYDFGEGV